MSLESKYESERSNRNRIVDFIVFMLTIMIIFVITSLSGLLLLAPPYAVTAYLATFVRKSKFSKPEG